MTKQQALNIAYEHAKREIGTPGYQGPPLCTRAALELKEAHEIVAEAIRQSVKAYKS